MTAIVITPDNNYLPYVPCSLAQIARFGSRADCVILVVPATTEQHHLINVATVATILSIRLEIVYLSEADTECIEKQKPLRFHGADSFATYMRLLLPEVLKDYDNVLYLDVDILIRAPLDELLEWKLDHPLAAVQELIGTGKHLFGSPHTPYFNAGVIRMSLDSLRQLKLWERSQNIMAERSDIRWYDQDVLNVLFEGQFDSLPLTYNVSDMLIRKTPVLPLCEDPTIVHFNGPTKPWQSLAKSRFAREWQELYTKSGVLVITQPLKPQFDPIDDCSSSSHRSLFTKFRNKTFSQASRLGRSALSPKTQTFVRRSASKLTGRLLSKLERIQTRLDDVKKPNRDSLLMSTTNKPNVGTQYLKIPTVEEQENGLDLLVSVARSGTNAIGDVLQRLRPNVHWLNEAYLGAGWAGLTAEDLNDEFPWFVHYGPDTVASLHPTKRAAAFRSFNDLVSANAVDLTRAILRSKEGRTLIKVFPDQLSMSALRDVISSLRPRLLFVRRENIFTYVSRLRAINLDESERTFARSWINEDLTSVGFKIRERHALKYAAHCDSWFDRMEGFVEQFDLSCTRLTYSGLFSTGEDIPLLESFYPGQPLVNGSGGLALKSELKVQDQRSDPSVLSLLTAVSSLSATAQAQLLRLPGTHQFVDDKRR